MTMLSAGQSHTGGSAPEALLAAEEGPDVRNSISASAKQRLACQTVSREKPLQLPRF